MGDRNLLPSKVITSGSSGRAGPEYGPGLFSGPAGPEEPEVMTLLGSKLLFKVDAKNLIKCKLCMVQTKALAVYLITEQNLQKRSLRRILTFYTLLFKPNV